MSTFAVLQPSGHSFKVALPPTDMPIRSARLASGLQGIEEKTAAAQTSTCSLLLGAFVVAGAGKALSVRRKRPSRCRLARGAFGLFSSRAGDKASGSTTKYAISASDCVKFPVASRSTATPDTSLSAYFEAGHRNICQAKICYGASLSRVGTVTSKDGEEEDEYQMKIPEISIGFFSVRPVCTAAVQSSPTQISVQGNRIELQGLERWSDALKKVEFDLDIKVEWVDEPRRKEIKVTGKMSIALLAAAASRLMPKALFETAGNKGLGVAFRTLSKGLCRSWVDDYKRWASDPALRAARAKKYMPIPPRPAALIPVVEQNIENAVIAPASLDVATFTEKEEVICAETNRGVAREGNNSLTAFVANYSREDPVSAGEAECADVQTGEAECAGQAAEHVAECADDIIAVGAVEEEEANDTVEEEVGTIVALETVQGLLQDEYALVKETVAEDVEHLHAGDIEDDEFIEVVTFTSEKTEGEVGSKVVQRWRSPRAYAVGAAADPKTSVQTRGAR